MKKDVLRNFAKLTENTCARVSRPQACNFIIKETLAQVFFYNFCEISKNTFFTKHLWATAFALGNRSLDISP